MSALARPPIVIAGPTAAGKSDVAMAVGRATPGAEIVVVDSMQVYRGMDIGTGKPTPRDRAEIPHHCLDLVDPTTESTVAHVAAVAQQAVRSIDERGGRAIVVAGTGLYLRALTDPMEIPGQWPELRSRLEADAALLGGPALYQQLTDLDPVAARRIEPANTRRIVRALEVTLGSGRRFSEFGPGLAIYPASPWIMFGLRWERDELRRRIAARVTAMMAAGWLDEVRRLAVQPLSRTARQALGYRELLAHLDGQFSLAEAVAETTVRTQQFAVRQLRWFRRDPRIRWIDGGGDPVGDVLGQLACEDGSQ